DRPEARGVADEAIRIAESSGDVDLLSRAMDARTDAAFFGGDYREAKLWADRHVALVDQISDPDHQAAIYADSVMPTVAVGRIDQARKMARVHEGIASRLSPHHRVHGVGLLLWTEQMAGGWTAIRDLAPEAERRVAANL